MLRLAVAASFTVLPRPESTPAPSLHRQDNGQGNIVHLDRHGNWAGVGCPDAGRALNSVAYQSSGSNSQYLITCIGLYRAIGTIDKDTGWQPFNGPWAVRDLWHLVMNCEQYGYYALHWYRWYYSGYPSGSHRYYYRCVQVPAMRNCRFVTSPWAYAADGSTYALNSLSASCASYEVMTHLEIIRPADPYIAYYYRCCQYW